MTNVFKYAFNGRDTGNVLVSIVKEGSAAILTVHDDGIGVEAAADANKSPGFGLTIITMLARQLNGSYVVEDENGVKSVVRFAV